MSTPDPHRGDEPGDPITPAPAPDPEPEHDSATPAFDDDQHDPDVLPRGQHGPTLDLGNGLSLFDRPIDEV